jgi:hypothetical protein
MGMIISDGREQGQFGHDAYSVVRKFFSCIRILKEKKTEKKRKSRRAMRDFGALYLFYFIFFVF